MRLFELEEALYRAGMLSGEQLPEIAMRMIEAGVDSPDACELAMLRAPTLRDSSALFERALAALGRAPLTQTEARGYLRRGILEGVATGRITPIKGAVDLWGLWHRFGYPEDLAPFVYLEDLWSDYPEDRPATEAEIVRYAQELLNADSNARSA